MGQLSKAWKFGWETCEFHRLLLWVVCTLIGWSRNALRRGGSDRAFDARAGEHHRLLAEVLASAIAVQYRACGRIRLVDGLLTANAPGDVADNSGSQGQIRVVAADGNVLKETSIYGEDVLVETIRIEPGRLARPLRR